MGLTGQEKISPNLQDRMAFHLLKRRGYHGFLAGELSVTDFRKWLAIEWASFPVLPGTKGQKRQVKREQSYYAGDGLNKALTKPETVEAVLEDVFALRQEEAKPEIALPEPIPQALVAPVPQRPSWLPIALTEVIAIAVIAWQWLSGQVQPAVPTVYPNGAPIPQMRPQSFGGSGMSRGLFAEIG